MQSLKVMMELEKVHNIHLVLILRKSGKNVFILVQCYCKLQASIVTKHIVT